MIKTIFLAFIFFIAQAQALVLENMQNDNALKTNLEGKSLGVFLGSFDPFHIGLQEVVTKAKDGGWCDYVLLFPIWEQKTSNQMSDVKVRQDMLFAMYENDPKVIVTRLSPQEVQKLLIKPHALNQKKKPKYTPVIKGLEIIGIVGSDTAFDFLTNKTVASIFMTGEVVNNEYFSSIAGSLMAIQAQGFLIALRKGEDAKVFKGKLLNKTIFGTFEVDHGDLSSENIRQRIAKSESVGDLLSPAVLKIIEDNNLYQN